MTLAPKNWKSFQHYKDRSPAWIKLHKGLLDDFAFSRLPVASRALAPLLWLLASEYENGDIDCSFEEIAYRLRMPENDFREALKPLIDAGFFVVASETLAKPERSVRLEKEKREEEEKKGLSRSVADAPGPDASEKFEEFWLAYPPRDGPNPRKPAELKFRALVKTGVDPELMIAAAKKLATDERARGNIGTRFIPKAMTWFNEQRWADHAAVAFFAASENAEFSIEQAVQMFAKTGHWSRYAPVSDVSQAPAELLARFGLTPDGRKLQKPLGCDLDNRGSLEWSK
jgi:hypothetical protein